MRPVSNRRGDAEENEVSNLELFFDLVFVFAVTQVSHLLVDHLGWKGALESLVILLVVWWSWQYTTWATNELDPERMPVRFLLLTIMMASLLMAVAIPGAFGSEGMLFALSYVFIQVVRQAFLTFAAAGRGSVERNRSAHVLAWFCAAAPIWIAGGLVEGDVRIVLWVLALAVDYAGPLLSYRVPRMEDVDLDSWDLESGHFTERFQLFTIIALGETIVITGASAADLGIDPTVGLALLAAFVSTVCLWWLYFNYMARVLEEVLGRAEGRTALGRDLFAYGHIPIIAGILLCAVGDDIVLERPSETLPNTELVVLVAGPTLYLLAFVLVRWLLTRGLAWRRALGALACVVMGIVALLAEPPALVTAGLLLAVLVGVIAHEYFHPQHRADPDELDLPAEHEVHTVGSSDERSGAAS